SAAIDDFLSVGTGLAVGQGGITSNGALAVTATNTPSYFADSVGIGTSTPQTALSVIGTSTTQGLAITNLANSLLAVDSSGNVIATTTASALTGYVTNTYASTTFVSFGYATSTFASTSGLVANYIPYTGATANVDLNNKALADVSTLSVGSATAPSGGVAYFNGNVGIGQSSPSAKLEVNGGGGNVVSKLYSGSAGAFAYFTVGRTADEVQFGITGAAGQFFTTAPSAGVAILKNAGSGDIWMGGGSTVPTLVLTNAGSVAGKVGIGTSTPATQFDVYGQGTNAIANFASSSNQSALYIASNGNVGVGSTSPVGLLSVTGSNANSSGVPQVAFAVYGPAGSSATGSSIIMNTGAGSGSGTNGMGGGDFLITTGSGSAGGAGQPGRGGNMTVTLGAGAGAAGIPAGVGGSLTVISGNGGVSSGGNSAGVGGAITLTAGNGGSGSNAFGGANGGSVTITAGAGGAASTLNSTTAGVGGNILLLPGGSTGSNSGGVGIGTSTPLSALSITGSSTGVWFGTNSGNVGKYLSVIPSTYTDTSTGSSTTATSSAFVSFGQGTLASINASTTYANIFGAYIGGAPTISGSIKSIGTSTALYIDRAAVAASTTNSYGLVVNAASGATNNYAAMFLGGNVGIGTSTPTGSTLYINGTTTATALFVNPAGSSTSSPALFGFSPAMAAGQATRLQFGDANNIIQNANGDRLQIGSYWGVEVHGNQEGVTPAFVTGAASDASLAVYGTTGNSGPIFTLNNMGGTSTFMTVLGNGNVGIGTTTPLANLSITSATTTGTFETIYATSTVTAGNLLQIAANGATTPTTGLLSVSGAGLTTGFAAFLNVNGATSLTSGGALGITGPTGANAYSANSGLVQIKSSGVFTTTAGFGSGGLLNIEASTTVGTVAAISDQAAMTGAGNLLTLSANGATTARGLLVISGTTLEQNANPSSGAGSGILVVGGQVFITASSTAQNSTSSSPLLSLSGWSQASAATTTFSMQTLDIGTGISGAVSTKLMFSFSSTSGSTRNLMSLTATGTLNLSRTALTGGPDVAENIPVSDPAIESGDLVTVDEVATSSGQYDTYDGNVYDLFSAKKTARPYDPKLLGVISTDPSIVLHTDVNAIENSNTVPAGNRPMVLAGRTLVKVNLDNGPIAEGDYITSSDVPGVGMKATKAGQVIGQALQSFDASSTATTTQILVFVRSGYWNGESVSDFAGVELDGTASPTLSKMVLSNFLSQTATSTPTSSVSELVTDRIVAGVEIITPEITTKGLTVDSVSSLNDSINFMSDTVFFGRPYFNSDTAGFAVIGKGQTSVDVTFASPYLADPIVSANISLDQTGNPAYDSAAVGDIFLNDIRYVITKKTANGFTIVINKAAPDDITFSWIALAVKDAKTFGTPVGSAPSGQSSGSSSGTTATTTSTSTSATSTASSTGQTATSTSATSTATTTSETATSTQATTTAQTATSTPDTIPPVITLNGANPMNLTVGDTFADPGATATDDVDGTVPVTASGTVDTSTAGTYTITYTASDAAGNTATDTRSVIVNAAVATSSSATSTSTATSTGQ
ncbi:MAG: DUF5011 domain-containing protein, partial [Patescibacteria group bacterium]|nr:DUF5011 domain-containing protein [Patescibacteria group bacterium]